MHRHFDKLKIIDLMRKEFDFTQRTLPLMTEEQMLQSRALYQKGRSRTPLRI